MKELMIPTILFFTIVAPLWLILHYRFKTKMMKGISEEEVVRVEEMLETIDKLIDRVETLEEILNEEHPNWRKSTRNRS